MKKSTTQTTKEKENNTIHANENPKKLLNIMKNINQTIDKMKEGI